MQHKERHEIDQPVQHASIQQYTIIYTIYLLLFRHACNQTPKSIREKLSAKNIALLPRMPCIALRTFSYFSLFVDILGNQIKYDKHGALGISYKSCMC